MGFLAWNEAGFTVEIGKSSFFDNFDNGECNYLGIGRLLSH